MSVWGDVFIVLYTVTAVLSTILSSLFQHEMAGSWDGWMDALIIGPFRKMWDMDVKIIFLKKLHFCS